MAGKAKEKQANKPKSKDPSKQMRRGKDKGQGRKVDRTRDYPENGYYRKNQYAEPRDQRDPDYTGGNDVSWYTRYPSIIGPASKIPFANRPGMTLDIGYLGDNDYSLVVPGVLVIDFVPSLGHSAEFRDAATQVSRELYQRVRAAYSSELDADGQDMLFYLVSLDSVFSYIAWLKRVYRVLVAYDPNNYITPTGLERAFGITDASFKALKADKTNFLSYINQLIAQTHTFRCPAVFDLFNRHYWMNDNIYTDAPGLNSQFCLYNQIGYYKYQELATPQGANASGLVVTPAPFIQNSGQLKDVTATILFNFGQELISALGEWSTAKTINGYFERAFKDVPSFTTAFLSDAEVQTFLYNQEVLMQMENCRTLPTLDSDVDVINFNGLDVTQDPLKDLVLADNSFTFIRSKASGSQVPPLAQMFDRINPVLNMHKQEVSQEDVIIASRMAPTFEATVTATTDTSYTVRLEVYSATEIPIQLRIVTAEGVSSPKAPSFGLDGARVLQFSNQVSIVALSLLSTFDWHPFVFNIGGVVLPNGHNLMYVHGDIENIAVMDTMQMDRLHEICLYSELNAFSLI